MREDKASRRCGMPKNRNVPADRTHRFMRNTTMHSSIHRTNRVRALAPMLLILALTLAPTAPHAAPAPETMNYEGVLRDAAGNPRTGTFDMVFRFFDAASGGNEILVDEHLGSGTGGVAVDGGLFNVALGSGNVVDGSASLPGDPYSQLSDVFRAYSDVWMQIEIDSGVLEVLTPRIKVESAPYALNASSLGGRSAGDYIDTSANVQNKSGDLGVENLDILDESVRFANGPLIEASSTLLRIHGGADSSDDLDLRASRNTLTAGAIRINGTGNIELRAGDGNFDFVDGAGTALSSIDPLGNLSTTADLTVQGGDINFANNGSISGTGTFNWIRGDEETDALFLYAGTGGNDGSITVRGQGDIEIISGNGETRFRAGVGTNLFLLGADGNLTLGQDSSVDDDWIVFDEAERLSWVESDTRFEFTDSLAVAGLLDAGNTNLAPVNYHRLGSSTTTNSDISNANDVHISGDLQVGDVLYATRSFVVGDDTPTANQAFSSVGTGSADSAEILDANDLYVSDDIELDGTLYVATLESSGTIRQNANINLDTMIDFDDSGSVNEARWFHDGNYIASEQLAELQEDGDFRIRGTLSQNVAFDVAESFLATEPLEPGMVVAVDASRPDAVRRSRGSDDVVIGVVSTRPGVLLGSAPFDVETLRQVWGEEALTRFRSESDRLRQVVLAESPRLEARLERLNRLEGQDTPEPSTREVLDADSPSGAMRRTRIAGPEQETPTRLARERVEIESNIEGRALEIFCEDLLVPVALTGRVPVQVDDSFGPIRRGDALAPSPLPGVAMRAQPGMTTLGVALADFPGGRGSVMALVQLSVASTGASGDRTAAPLRGARNDTLSADRGRTASPDGARDALAASRMARGDGASPLVEVLPASQGFPALSVDAEGRLISSDRGERPQAGAELFEVTEEARPGELLVVAEDGRLTRSIEAMDRRVVGSASETSALRWIDELSGFAEARAELSREFDRLQGRSARARADWWATVAKRYDREHTAVAVSGTIEVWVDAGFGAVRPGDFLTTSPPPGHAMLAGEGADGAIVGKALQSLDSGTGRLRMLVMSR